MQACRQIEMMIDDDYDDVEVDCRSALRSGVSSYRHAFIFLVIYPSYLSKDDDPS